MATLEFMFRDEAQKGRAYTPPHRKNVIEVLLKLKEAGSHDSIDEALKECIQLCAIKNISKSKENSNQNTAKLLVGVEDEDIEKLS